MTGAYLEWRISLWIVAPVRAFRVYIFRDVLPAFGNLSKRADEMADEYYSDIGSQPAGEDCDIDMADVAEDAHDRALSWYQMMVSLRQSMLNQLAAGLFHLTEQQLAALCRDGGFRTGPPRDTKLTAATLPPPRRCCRSVFGSQPRIALPVFLRLVA
jgi:hypothetical protein